MKFSVVIPALNEEHFIGHLLDSLVTQTCKDFEVIVVDGGSMDKTIVVAKKYLKKLPHLTILKSPRKSLPLQRNMGAHKARGEWLVFVDADSVLVPYCLDRAASYIDTHRASLLTGWYSPDSERPRDAFLILVGNILIESSVILHRPVAAGPLAFVTRTAHEEVGGYDQSYRYGEDADYTRRLSEHGHKLHIIRETLVISSLRRFRKEGFGKMIRTYVFLQIRILMFKSTPKNMSGYDTGGAFYNEDKK